MDLDQSSLGELFVSGQSILTELEETSLSTANAEYQAKVHDGLRRLERAHDLVNKLAIFSSNELIDEISPQNLRFLLIPAYLGDLTLKRTGPIEQRKSVLETGKDYFQQYLAACQEHQLLQSQDIKMFQENISNENEPSRIPPAQQRQQKIEQFKREKATLAKIKELRERLDSTDDNEDTDDIERDWVMALIDLHVTRSLQHLHSIQQEMVMLKEMEVMRDKRMESKATASSSSLDSGSSARSNWGHDKPLLNKLGRPLQPFVITSKREQLKNQVFRPGWSLPTMTIEEYLQQEEERGNIIRGGGKEPEPKPEIDDNDHEALDAETMRQREWDEFKEANPRGWGNRGNKG